MFKILEHLSKRQLFHRRGNLYVFSRAISSFLRSDLPVFCLGEFKAEYLSGKESEGLTILYTDCHIITSACFQSNNSSRTLFSFMLDVPESEAFPVLS